jgi:hypothetical protein
MAHTAVFVAGIGFGSQSGSGFTSGSSSAHTLGEFQSGEATGRQDPGALNTGSSQPAAGAERGGDRGRDRSRWDRDRDQSTNNQEKPREASSHEEPKQGHQPDGYVPKFPTNVVILQCCEHSRHLCLRTSVVVHAVPSICAYCSPNFFQYFTMS